MAQALTPNFDQQSTRSFSDNDSAFSSEQQSSPSCSSDACICESSFHSEDSAVASTSKCPCNPFGSFRHSGPLPYSVFEATSSFSSSPRRASVNMSSSSFEDSTHIYMNLLDRSDYSMVKTTKFWSTYLSTDSRLDASLGSRPPCEGKEDTLVSDRSVLRAEMNIRDHADMDVTIKVNAWRHHSNSAVVNEDVTS